MQVKGEESGFLLQPTAGSAGGSRGPGGCCPLEEQVIFKQSFSKVIFFPAILARCPLF